MHVGQSPSGEILAKHMKYVLAAITSLFVGASLVWSGSWMASCGHWSTAWLCRVAARVGGAVLAPGILTEMYGGSKLIVLMSDTLFYAIIFFVLLCLSIQQRNRSARDDSSSTGQ